MTLNNIHRYFLLYIVISVFLTNQMFSQTAHSNVQFDSTIQISNQLRYSNPYFDLEMINSFPLRKTEDYLRYLPGVVEQRGKFHINGSRFDEIDYTLDGLSILNHFSGEQLFNIPKYVLKSIGISTSDQNSTSDFQGSEAIIYRLKNGSNNFKFSLDHTTDNLGFNSTDDFYEGQQRLGAYWYGYNETNFSAEGPIIKDHLSFYANANYKYMRDRNPQLYPGIDGLELVGRDYEGNIDEENVYLLNMPKGIVYGNSSQSYNLLGKLSYEQDDLNIDLIGIFENKIIDAPRNHVTDYFNTRLGKVEDNTTFISISANHKISNTFNYSISGSYSYKFSETYDQYLKDDYWSYGDSVANADVGAFWERTESEIVHYSRSGLSSDDTRFIQPYNISLNGFSFEGNNRIPINYSKSLYQNINFNTRFNYQLYRNSLLTFGFSVKSLLIRDWSTRNYQTNFARLLNSYNYDEQSAIKNIILEQQGVSNIGYTNVGGESNSGWSNAPKPLIAKAYIGNKYEKNKLMIDFGLEYHRFDLDNFLMIDPKAAHKSFDYFNNIPSPLESGYKKSDVSSSFNPKFFIKYSFSDKNSLSFLANRNSSIPHLIGLYSSFSLFYNSVLAPPSFYFSEQTFNNDIKPVQTDIFEISYRHKFPQVSLSGNAYYKFVENQLRPEEIKNSDESKSGYSFWTLSNKASSTIAGLILTARLNRIKGFSLQSTISLQTSEGTKSEFLYDTEDGGFYIRNSEVPLDYHQVFSAVFALDYLFSQNSNDIDILKDLKITVLAKYNSGHPYTIGSGSGNIDGYAPFQKRVSFQDVNSYYTPAEFQMNLRVDKSFEISNNISLNLYIYALNLFNNVNVKDVFLRTGSAIDDGFPFEENIVETYGENYKILHELTKIKYNPKDGQQTMFGEPRQLIMGLNLNF